MGRCTQVSKRRVLGPPCRYLNAIQTMCPHILRYLTTAVITNKDVRKRRQVLKDLVKVIQQVRGLGGTEVELGGGCWLPSGVSDRAG